MLVMLPNIATAHVIVLLDSTAATRSASPSGQYWLETASLCGAGPSKQTLRGRMPPRTRASAKA